MRAPSPYLTCEGSALTCKQSALICKERGERREGRLFHVRREGQEGHEELEGGGGMGWWLWGNRSRREEARPLHVTWACRAVTWVV